MRPLELRQRLTRRGGGHQGRRQLMYAR
jgi:hypothetical protein